MKVFSKPTSLYETFERKGGPAKQATHYCPGCTHGVIHRLVAEVLYRPSSRLPSAASTSAVQDAV